MINTLQFWLKVKEEFNPSGLPYLCKSQTFKEYWRADPNRTLSELAFHFLSERSYDVHVGSSVLFFESKMMSTKECNELNLTVRLDFIEWNLKRLQ